MKKSLFIITILFMAFTFIACGNPYMGKLVKKDMTQKIITPSGKNHHFTLNHIRVDYNYSIYPEQQMIILKGTIDDRQQDAQSHFVKSGWDLKESHLDMYYLNAERRVVDFCVKNFPLGHFTFPYPFEAKCRFSPTYQYIALSYKYKYVNSENVVKIYEHRLDVE